MIGRPGRGGRRRTVLTADQTKTLLDRHAPAAAQGGLVVAHVFKRDYEQLVRHKVAPSSIYRMLAKAGWRKLAPRPRHPKKDPAEEVAFKKTSLRK